MAEGFISSVECACGTCHTLMPQHLLDAGKTFLWGHKQRLKASSVGAAERRQVNERKPRPGAVTETSYARTLLIARENLQAVENQLACEHQALHMLETEYEQKRESIAGRKLALRSEKERLERLVAALESFGDPKDRESSEAPKEAVDNCPMPPEATL